MKYLLCIGLLLSSVTSVYAQTSSSSFNIRFLYGSDMTPPTTPVLNSATPISTTQIDLDWSASTDNYTLQGYVVTRGTSTVATTTLTSFSDTSVVASTTYTYSVRAFDNSFNYSSSSNSIATTTPDVVVAPVAADPDNATEGTVARIVTRDVSISPGISTTSLAVETARPVRLTVRWGRSTDYELGFLVSELYAKRHVTAVTDLEPGTTYEYEIIAETPFGLKSVISAGQFTTLNPAVSTAPPNVVRFLATAQQDDVQLSWQLSADENISFVRVVRSHLGFPAHPQDGAIVYQGTKRAFTDSDILSEYSPVYYTAFTYSTEGKISSGAVAVAFAQSDTPPGGGDGDSGTLGPAGSTVPVKVTEATSTVEQERYTPDMRVPELSELFIVQSGIEYSFLNPDIVLRPTDSFIVQIPVASVAGNLKSIIGTVLDPTNNTLSYAFLLRINEDKTYYQAVIPALSVVGDSVLEVVIYDYEALTVATYKAPIKFAQPADAPEAVLFPDVFFQGPNLILLGSTLLGAVLLTLLLVLRHRREDKGDEDSADY
jgi:hypothetical protein